MYHDVRFHRFADFETWRKGAPLEFAIRALAPLEWANYKAFWSPENAPDSVSKKVRRAWGWDDREEFWQTLLNLIKESSWELRVLFLLDDPSATWEPVLPPISPLKKASLTGFHATAKHIAAKAVSPSSETMRTI